MPLKDIIALVFRNRPLLFLIVADTFNGAGLFVVLGFAFYYFTYVARNIALLSVFMLATSIAALLGTVAGAWIGVRIGKRKAYSIFLILAALSFASSVFLAVNAWLFITIFCLASLFQGVALSLGTALFSDTVIYGEWKTGKNIRAFTMGLQALTAKLGIFLRSAVIPLGLMAIGFVANQESAPGVVQGIRTIMGFAPAAAVAIAAVALYFSYGMDDKNVVRMQDELAIRR